MGKSREEQGPGEVRQETSTHHQAQDAGHVVSIELQGCPLSSMHVLHVPCMVAFFCNCSCRVAWPLVRLVTPCPMQTYPNPGKLRICRSSYPFPRPSQRCRLHALATSGGRWADFVLLECFVGDVKWLAKGWMQLQISVGQTRTC